MSVRQPLMRGLSSTALVCMTGMLSFIPLSLANAAPEATNQPAAANKQTDTPSSLPTSGNVRFGCQVVGGDYTVVYSPISQPGEVYPWAKPSLMGGGWTPERRCAEIARRLEFYRPDGLLEMQTSVENGYDIVCVTTEENPACRIVLTVPEGQDPIATRNRVFENLTVADSGQSTTAVNTFADEDAGNLLNQLGEAIGVDLPSLSRERSRSTGIDLRPFLDRADGGTGERLR